MSRRRPARGFSLVELGLVIAIVAVVGAIALPRWTGAMQNYRLELAAGRVAADLRLAQARANNTSASVTVAFVPSAGTYQIVGMNDLDRKSSPYIVNLSANPYLATITAADFGGSTSAVFDGFGTPAQAGTVVVRVGGRQRTVVLEAGSGRVSIQ